MSKGESKEYRTRLKEITSVLHKYGITRGITPQKLRMILEDLGPTYIKIGQIMSLHSDILPKRYCDELMCLRSEVTPMEFPEVKEVIEQAYGCPWNEMFAFIQIIIAICPIVPLFYFATKVYGFCNVLNKRRCIRKKNI